MDDQGEEGLDRTPTAAWLAEQEAKQAAYAARRHAWTRRRRPHDTPEEDAVEPSSATTGAIDQAGHATRRRSPRGSVHDPRQGRFEF